MLNQVLKLTQSTIRLLPFICKDFTPIFRGRNMVYHPWNQLWDSGLINIYALNENREPYAYITTKKIEKLDTGLDPIELLNSHFDLIYSNTTYNLYRTRNRIKVNWFEVPDYKEVNSSTYGDLIWTDVKNQLGLFYVANNLSLGLLYNTESTKQLFANEFKCPIHTLPAKLLPHPDLERETFRKAKTLLYT